MGYEMLHEYVVEPTVEEILDPPFGVASSAKALSPVPSSCAVIQRTFCDSSFDNSVAMESLACVIAELSVAATKGDSDGTERLNSPDIGNGAIAA